MATIADKTLAQRLGERLKQDGRKQYRLAVDADVDRSTLNRLFNGESEPSWKTVAAVGLALRIGPKAFGELLYLSLAAEAKGEADDANGTADDKG